MKVLVTGAAGFIGSHFAEKLIEHQHDVYCIDCITDYYCPEIKKRYAQDIQNLGGKFSYLNLATDTINGFCDDVDCVFHFAAQPGLSTTTNFEMYQQNNLIATYNLLQNFVGKKLQLFVYISTSSVYGKYATSTEDSATHPISFYGVTKLASENLAMSYHYSNLFPVCSVRLFSVYGERERPEKLYPKLIRSILENKPFYLYEGSENHSRSFTYVRDIVEGLGEVLKNNEKCRGEIFNMGSEQEATTAKGIRIIEEIMGKKAHIIKIAKRARDQQRTCANIEKIKNVLHYSPKTSIQKGLEAEVQWYLNHIHEKYIYE